ncbi:AMP-binding enzyme domain-containing protein [Aulographum hederae CBS 113979]|uniref:AMP-binding enzyme domain-containing protein n=1 Tax=Aulographum hederae CBS 113979 TaxID=1176131 RepID=A0A6G1H4M4_9PEZI|nr:AMP-binding enzyme domain-containing protein [Aulographum hederae CBS 113979]
MVFHSKFPGVARPTQDVFNYIFSRRGNYPADKIMYKTDSGNRTLTLAELEHKSRQLATTLVEKYGIKPQDTVSILATDCILYPVFYLSILAAGAVVELIPLQKELGLGDVTARMEQAEAKVLITDPTYLSMGNQAAAKVGAKVLVPETEPELFHDSVKEYHDFKIDDEETSGNTIAFLNRTSGSTGGKMKSVITTHAHFIAIMEATLYTIPANTDPEKDVWCSSLSLGFFINAKLHIGLNILLGIPVVLMDSPFGPDNMDIIERHGITFLFIPPPVAASLAKHDDSEKEVDVSSMKWMLSAGAAVNPNLAASTAKRLNGVHLDSEWGTTETLLIAIQMEGHDSPKGTAGKLVNGIEAKVLDTTTGEELGPNDEGEIWIRNHACEFRGYHNNDEANASTFDKDGWFISGDFGHIDEDNNVYIADRMKELIRVGGGYGVHIAAPELENVLFEHPAVSQVIVTGVPDEKAGEEYPTAFVILKADWEDKIDMALVSLTKLANQKLTGLQKLTGGFVFMPKFPQISFKINRRAMKLMAVEENNKREAANVKDAGLPRYIEVA